MLEAHTLLKVWWHVSKVRWHISSNVSVAWYSTKSACDVWVACMDGMQIKCVLQHVQAARLVKPDKLQHIDVHVGIAK